MTANLIQFPGRLARAFAAWWVAGRLHLTPARSAFSLLLLLSWSGGLQLGLVFAQPLVDHARDVGLATYVVLVEAHRKDLLPAVAGLR